MAKAGKRVKGYIRRPSGETKNAQLLMYGGAVALVGAGAMIYFWATGLPQPGAQQPAAGPAAQPAAQQTPITAIIPPFGAQPPGTALITPGAVNPLGAFRTIFPFFGGAQFFTLTRRSCDPVIGGIPTQLDLASQGIVITSYQVNNIGPIGPAVCGVPNMSITVGTTDPTSAAKLTAMGFAPGTFGGGFFGGLWPQRPGPVVPPFPGVPPVLPGGPIRPPFGFPPFGGQPGPFVPPWVRPVPGPLPPTGPLFPWWYPYRNVRRRKRDHRHERDPVHVIGVRKHGFIKPLGHVVDTNR